MESYMYLTGLVCKTKKIVMAKLHGKQGLSCDNEKLENRLAMVFKLNKYNTHPDSYDHPYLACSHNSTHNCGYHLY